MTIPNVLISLADTNGLCPQFISITENLLNFSHIFYVEIRLSGHYQEMRAYLHALSQQCFLFLIHDAEIINSNEQLKLKLIIIDACNKSNSQNIIFHQNIKTSFDLYSIKKIKYVGFVKSHKHLSAIFDFPDGETNEFHVGDYVGLEHAKITRIDEDKIFLCANHVNVSIKKY